VVRDAVWFIGCLLASVALVLVDVCFFGLAIRLGTCTLCAGFLTVAAPLQIFTGFPSLVPAHEWTGFPMKSGLSPEGDS
jgi:hypothetical protein